MSNSSAGSIGRVEEALLLHFNPEDGSTGFHCGTATLRRNILKDRTH